MRLAAGTRLGRYEIGAPIGAGGMGEVYRARDPTLRRDVAVKVLPAGVGDGGERGRRFEKEARAAAELEHPNILAVHDVGVDGGVRFIVTELLDGVTLAEVLRRGPLPRARATEIAVQIARGVAAAHDRGLVHRDLKPSNVFVCRDGRVKILDFGLAAHVAEGTPGGDDATMTETGAILGTPAYMSPEQVRGQRVDPRADLFALGVILYEMLSGRRPFAGDGAVELGHAILTQDPEPLSDPALDAVVRLCIAKDPTARLRSAEDLALVLANLPAPRAAPPARSQRAWALAFAGALAAVMAIGWVTWPSHEVATAPRYTRITYRHERNHSARFAPDGRTVLYTANERRDKSRDSERIFASTPGRPEARPLTEPGTRLVAVSANGEMLIEAQTGDGKLVISRAALAGGVPRVVYDDVVGADFSPEGRELAIVRKVGAMHHLEYPVGRVLFTTPFIIGRGPRVSPRGDQVAFLLFDSPSVAERHGMQNLSGTVEVVGRDGTRRTLGQRWTLVSRLAWSPDGREVWVSGRRAAFRSIYALDLDGHERTVLALPDWINLQDIARDGRVLVNITDSRARIAALVLGSSEEIDLGWYDQSMLSDLSPDGRLVLFDESGESSHERSEAYVRNTDGSPAVDLGAGAPYALSPDGAWALVSPTTPESSLELVPTGAGVRRPLASGPIEHYAQAYFFADGQRIAIRARDAGHGMRVWIQDIAGGDPRPISDEGIDWLVRPAASGDVVPACRADGSCALYPVDGGAPRPLPTPQGAWPLQLTADGESLVVARPMNSQRRILTSNESALWLVDLATGRERFLHALEFCRREACDPRTVRLTPDARGYAYVYSYEASIDIVLIEGLR